ncbi:MAG: hypothetical protein QOG14_5245, partial [Mycobacterium sp.]|nr:hypothetical protein [Mycobacterium sp.]
SVVVTGAADVNGVFSALDSAGDADPTEVGLLDAVPGAEAEAEIVGGPVGAGSGVDAPNVVGGPVVIGAVGVGVSTRGASTAVVVVGTTVGVDCGTVGVWICTGGGASGVATGSWVRTGAAGTGGGGEGGTGGACGVGVAAGACCRSPGPSPPAGAGTTVVVGSSGAACAT